MSNSKKNKQTSLFSYGFTKKVLHRGKYVYTSSEPTENAILCKYCANTFKTNQALQMHVRWCEKNKPQSSSDDINTTPRGDFFRHPPNRTLMTDTKHRHVARLVVEKLIANVLVAEQDNAMPKKHRSFTLKPSIM